MSSSCRISLLKGTSMTPPLKMIRYGLTLAVICLPFLVLCRAPVAPKVKQGLGRAGVLDRAPALCMTVLDKCMSIGSKQLPELLCRLA